MALTSLEPHDSARYVRGIGPRRFEALNRLGIHSVRDLIYFFPRRYLDRSQFVPIAKIEPGREATVQGEVIAVHLRPLKRMTLCEVLLKDETGIIPAVWFNQPYLKNKFKVEDQLILSGKADRYGNRLQLNSPEYEHVTEEEHTVHVGRIAPVYALTEGLTQRALRFSAKEVIESCLPNIPHDYLPVETLKRFRLMPLSEALCQIHFPDSFELLESARRRIIFEELFLFQLLLLSRVRATKTTEEGISLTGMKQLLPSYKVVLPFELTDDQEKAIGEIANDVSRAVPMNRLLQGEVGSGKTVVAAYFLYAAAKNRAQAVLVVPTEILAEQHFQKLKPMFTKLGVNTALLTSSVDDLEKQAIKREAASGKIQILIGTHALLQEDVDFKKLALVIVDEQHRFGVEQRAKLVLRKPRPHFMVMTATPIPRTLGLTLYGELDISTLEQLPKGRKPVRTVWMPKEKQAEALTFVHERVTQANEQAYILFPVIDEAEDSNLQAATKEFETLKRGLFRDVALGLVHGRLSKKERDEVMGKFRDGQLKVLIATSVIEVGIDHPNVTCIVIENAERFGLSQLHQMRGRIGRGAKTSYCYLVGTPTTEDAQTRLEVMTATSDGFKIAEEDLALRGPGDFFGTRQSGIPFFRIANLVRDHELLMDARNEAARILNRDANLSMPEHEALAKEIRIRKSQFEFQ